MAANFFDQFDPATAKPEGGGKGGNFFDQFDPGAAKPEPSGGTASDLAKSVKAGVQRLPGMATGLADLPFALAAGARPFAKAADALGEATGFQPGKWADETKFSAGYEQGKKAVDEAWKDGSAGDIALSYLKNPGYTANQVAESLPGMVAGGVAGRALMGVGRVAGVAADAAAGTAARAAVASLAAQSQSTANAPANGDVLQQVAEPAAQAQAAINSEATFHQSTAGESNGAQADQAQQAVPQPAQAGAAQAGAPAAQGLSNGAAPTLNTGAQAAPQAGPQAQVPWAGSGAAAAVEATRPGNWRTSNRASLETMAAAEKLGIAYQVPADTKGAVKVMRDGVAEHWAVEDPYLLDAISAMSYTPPGIVKAMAPFKRLLTFGVTVNPTFKIRNLIRDSLSAIAQSDLSYNPAENVAKGWKATSKNSHAGHQLRGH